MTTLADIFQQHGAEYLERYGAVMPPHQKKVMQDILTCRTNLLGGHTWFCENCQQFHYNYHSCKNRACPQCQHEQADKLLPAEYFLVTFTIPEHLKPIVRQFPKRGYHILFQSSADSLKKLAAFVV